MAGFKMQGFYILEEETWTHLQFDIRFCVTFFNVYKFLMICVFYF